MATRRFIVAATAVACLLLVAGCGDDPQSDTTTNRIATTATTTTTTLSGGGPTETPETAPDLPPPDDVPDSFVVRFDERYVCHLGPAGESDIVAHGTGSLDVMRSPDGIEVAGLGVMDVTGLLRAGDICSGEATGTHQFDVSGAIEIADDGTATLNMLVAGTWYATWEGEIACRGGLPPSGPWEWPPEQNVETLTFSPLEDGATWENDVAMGMCRGTVTRTIDFTASEVRLDP
jgi:hypothetical protein